MTWLTTVWLRAYSRVQPCWISAICKKVLHKIYVATFNGVQKNRPKDKYYFLEIKYSKTSLATTLIWRVTPQNYFEILWPLTVSIAFLFFLWVIISPHKHPGFCSNWSPAFSYPEYSKMATKHPGSPKHVEFKNSQKAVSFFGFGCSKEAFHLR